MSAFCPRVVANSTSVILPGAILGRVISPSLIALVVTALSARLSASTARSVIVKAVEPVTSPVCVALVTLAVFAAIAAVIEASN